MPHKDDKLKQLRGALLLMHPTLSVEGVEEYVKIGLKSVTTLGSILRGLNLFSKLLTPYYPT